MHLIANRRTLGNEDGKLTPMKLKGVSETDDPDVALLGLHICVYKEISRASHLVLIKRTPIRKRLLNQGKDVDPLLL